MRNALAIAAVVLASSGAFAAPPARVPMDMAHMTSMTDSELAKHVGEWLYDQDGTILGSFERLRGKDAALVHVSTFFMPGNKFVVIPERDLGVSDGWVVLRSGTLASLEQLPEAR